MSLIALPAAHGWTRGLCPIGHQDTCWALKYKDITSVRDVLTKQVASADRLTRETDTFVTHVFHEPDGSPIKDSVFRKAWVTAREAAGYPAKLIHDFRRTAVRNLSRAGVVDTVAMKLTGHKTRSVFDRYLVVSRTDLDEAMEKLENFRRQKRQMDLFEQGEMFPKEQGKERVQ